ncbi:HalOD1 output domain-containing protein [Halobacterium litoreum]|uniref:HalOD1 output domain-containing protein n=1 Tax=Halobacterium litoreum TaxID=2039234 RepID=A0ABD5NC24_9EURY|nr:HalOD1 output domain-containing protein [Halobacterium litoreum]UHH14641.1 hypothetical protein LT972_06485 [Halobacterium litoreum]
MESDRNSSPDRRGVDAVPEIRRTDWSDHDQASTAIAEAIAATTEQRQTDLEPLQYTIDADALDALLDGGSDVEVTFAYEDLEVRVTSGGVLEVWA